MIEIDGQQVIESYLEYGVQLPEDLGGQVVESENLVDAEGISGGSGYPIVARHVYVTGYFELYPSSPVHSGP